MNRNRWFAMAFAAAVGVATIAGSLAIAESSKDVPTAAGAPDSQLPPGMTAEDMQAYMEASTPGKMHELLVKDAGTWQSKCTMWMSPAAEPMVSEGKSVVTPIMGGRFIKCEMYGEVPGMGPYNGLAIHGYDNVTKKFMCTWIDNMSTTFANGEGELSKDGKTLTMNYTVSCPIAKKPVAMREVTTSTGPNEKTVDIFGTDPKSGKEFQMMKIELARK